MAHLFEPLTIKDVTLRNRIGVSPMCQYSYTDGFSNDWQLVTLGAKATGGVGLVIFEATAVEARGRITPFDVGIWSNAHIEPIARVVRFVQAQGAVAGIQIAHAGRKACTTQPWMGGKPVPQGDANWWQVVGPSPLAFSEEHQVPHELTLEEIQAVKQHFVDGAARSLEAGFTWLEIHAAHGYLLNEFLSPLSNRRNDAYGGSFENRIRMLVEIVQKVQTVWPERLPLTVRISGTEWVEGGWNVEDSVALAKVLKKEGVDLVDCSSGANVPNVRMPLAPGYQVHIADAVRNQGGMASAAVGLITEPKMADEIIRSGKADLVLMARELMRNPNWPVFAAKELGQPSPAPLQYVRAF